MLVYIYALYNIERKAIYRPTKVMLTIIVGCTVF